MASGREDLESLLGLEPGRYPEHVQSARAENFMSIMVEIIAHRAWQQSERSVALPDLLFTFFDPDPEKVQTGLSCSCPAC